MTVKTLAGLGDSQTDFVNTNGIDGFDTWVPVLTQLLAAKGGDVRGRGFGVAGDTSANLLARTADGLYYDVPTFAAVFIGINDAAASISTTQTTANIQAILKALKHGAVGDGLTSGPSVAGQANLPATGEPGQRYVVLSDTSTTGGVAAYDSTQAATITGAVSADGNGNKQAVWEYRYPLAGENGWGRVAVAATAASKVTRLAVIGQGYRNYPTSGDTVSGTSSNAGLIAAQQAAATVEGALWVDLYSFQKARIQAGTDPDLSGTFDATRAWNAADNNIHHNTYGHLLVALALLSALSTTEPAWLTTLTS